MKYFLKGFSASNEGEKEQAFVLFFMVIIIAMAVSLAGCGASDSVQGAATSEDTKSEQVETTVEEHAAEPEAKQLTQAEVDALLAEQPIYVTNVEYFVQDEQYKALYPDLLMTTLQNNTDQDIKNAYIAYVAWDENNLPVLITQQSDVNFSDASYIVISEIEGANIPAGSSGGGDSGMPVNENCGIAKTKAMVYSCDFFDGTTWENPYFSDFCQAYQEQKLVEN